jgi:AcrR family transcriptional regulator
MKEKNADDTAELIQVAEVDRSVDERFAFVDKDERVQKAWDYKLRGVSTPAIAKALGVSIPTVYSYFNEMANAYREEIAQTDALTLIVEHLQWLESIQKTALVSYYEGGNKKAIKRIKGANGEWEEQEIDIPDPNQAAMLKTALECRKMILKLQIDTGIIPNDPEKLFKSLEVYEDREIEKEEDVIDKDPETLQEEVLKLLKGMRNMDD